MLDNRIVREVIRFMAETLTTRVAKQLRQHILRGVLTPGERLGPEEELGKRFKVSRATIQNAIAILQGEELVERPPHKGARVARAVPRPSIGRHQLRSGRLAYLRWEYDSSVLSFIRGLTQICREHEETPVLLDARRSVTAAIAMINHLPVSVRGVVMEVLDDQGFVEAVQRATRQGVHFVQFERINKAIDAASVTSDDRVGAYEATRHLIDLHGQPVYHIGFESELSSLRDRRLGWIDAMVAHGFFDWADYFISLSVSFMHTHRVKQADGPEEFLQESYERVLHLLRSDDRERFCFFCVGDLSAMGVYRAAEDAGRAIGRDVFVVGFGDYPMCQRTDPPMSSVRQDAEAMGAAAASLLYEQIEQGRNLAVHRVLPVQLLVRESSLGTNGVKHEGPG